LARWLTRERKEESSESHQLKKEKKRGMRYSRKSEKNTERRKKGGYGYGSTTVKGTASPRRWKRGKGEREKKRALPRLRGGEEARINSHHFETIQKVPGLTEAKKKREKRERVFAAT